MFYILITVCAIAWMLTWSVRHYAFNRNIMDQPNHRSSHAVPTPRGGGLAFVAVFIFTFPVLVQWGLTTWAGSLPLMGAGLFIALLGFLDDHRPIAAHWRFLGHCLACLLAVYWLGGMPSIVVLKWVMPATLLLDGLAVLYLIWLLNLYNFMDGIDGIAGLETVSVCLSIAGVYWFSGAPNLVVLPLVLAASVGGFLFWNLPPARIFMGDVGSGFLGFILGVLSIQSAAVNRAYFWSWLILLGVFIVDATLTLLQRLCRRQKIYEAHRSHAYQHAARHFGRHLPVTLAVFIINIVWLFPLALFVGLGWLDGMLGLLIAYIPLVIMALQFKAGQSD